MPKRDPFEEEDEEKPIKVEATDDEEPPKVVSTEPDANDDDEEPSEPGEKGEWARKKANRYREMKEAAEAERKKAADLERQLTDERTARIATEQTSRMYAEHVQRTAQPQADPWEPHLKQVAETRRDIIAAAEAVKAAGGADMQQKLQRLNEQWGQTEVRQQEIVAHKVAYQREAQARQNAPNVERQVAETAAAQQIRMRYPDIMNNPDAVAYMNHTFMRAITAEKKPNDWNTADEVAAETRRRFKIGSPAISAATKARYSGIGGGSRANGSNGGGSGKVTMNKAMKQMALTRYAKIAKEKGEAAALKKWAENEGRGLDEDGD